MPRRDRRLLITIEGLTEGAADAWGEPSRTYASVGTAWARRTPISGEQVVVGEQISGEATHLFEIGWASHLASRTTADRITAEGVTYDIISIDDPDGRSRDLHIRAKERGA